MRGLLGFEKAKIEEGASLPPVRSSIGFWCFFRAAVLLGVIKRRSDLIETPLCFASRHEQCLAYQLNLNVGGPSGVSVHRLPNNRG